MLAHGAEQVLIDGAIDRRAASSPDVADGLVMATGRDAQPRDLRGGRQDRRRRRAGAPAAAVERHHRGRAAARAREQPRQGALVDDALDAHPLPPRFVLAEPPRREALLREGIPPRWLIVPGALPEAFLNVLVAVRAARAAATHDRRLRPHEGVPVSARNRLLRPRGHRDRNARADLAARHHRQPGRTPVAQLRLRCAARPAREAIPDVPIFDVLHPDYRGAGQPASA